MALVFLSLMPLGSVSCELRVEAAHFLSPSITRSQGSYLKGASISLVLRGDVTWEEHIVEGLNVEHGRELLQVVNILGNIFPEQGFSWRRSCPEGKELFGSSEGDREVQHAQKVKEEIH